jgi:hypothetical protein
MSIAAAGIIRAYTRYDEIWVCETGGAIIHDGSPADLRLRRCALVASGGSLEKLKYYVALLKVDYRDVIVAGEYDVVGGKLTRVRDLTMRFE